MMMMIRIIMMIVGMMTTTWLMIGMMTPMTAVKLRLISRL